MHTFINIYSGIPNKAFYLAAKAFEGYSYEKAGPIWWETMGSGQIPPRCTFIQFADVTVEVAGQLFGNDAAKIVRDAWDEVGVMRNEPKDPKDPNEPEPPKNPKDPKDPEDPEEPKSPGDCDTM